MVSEDSAMLVLRITFLWVWGRAGKMAWCSSQGTEECRATSRHSGAPRPRPSPSSRACSRRISPRPGRKTSTAPGAPAAASSSCLSMCRRIAAHSQAALSSSRGSEGSKAALSWRTVGKVVARRCPTCSQYTSSTSAPLLPSRRITGGTSGPGSPARAAAKYRRNFGSSRVADMTTTLVARLLVWSSFLQTSITRSISSSL